MKIKNSIFLLGCLGGLMTACTSGNMKTEWVCTTPGELWQQRDVEKEAGLKPDSVLTIDTLRTAQTIEGFGTCFNELGWTSLNRLNKPVRDSILREMFTPEGAGFTVCRMPVGANDFSLEWYSYDETEGDFGLEHFSIVHDQETLIPFIKAAKRYNPALKLWASPWSPPSWMKYNKHYACVSSERMMQRMRAFMKEHGGNDADKKEANHNQSRFRMEVVDNGLSADREGHEGSDGFIQEDAYLKAYSCYFGAFIDAYEAEGIDIAMVMPQNEFNSPQIFPSCCWKASSLARFIGKYLGPEMQGRGVEVFLGTIERANAALTDSILSDPDAARYIKGCGFQWAGKDALPLIQKEHPGLKFYQTEQECGNGLNDWEGAVYSWNLMRHYLNNGVQVYDYWNTSLLEGGISRWGWRQNSLVTVNGTNHTFRFTPEYYVLKHASHYVHPGAKRLILSGGYGNALAFLNADGTVAVLLANQTDKALRVEIRVGEKNIRPELPAHSFNTLVINP